MYLAVLQNRRGDDGNEFKIHQDTLQAETAILDALLHRPNTVWAKLVSITIEECHIMRAF